MSVKVIIDELTAFYGKQIDRDFDKFVESFPETFWAHYDLAAVRLGWEARKTADEDTVPYDPDWVMLPQTWCSHYKLDILDPDGWRFRVVGEPPLEPQHWDVRINELEFLRRAAASTVHGLNNFPVERFGRLLRMEKK